MRGTGRTKKILAKAFYELIVYGETCFEDHEDSPNSFEHKEKLARTLIKMVEDFLQLKVKFSTEIVPNSKSIWVGLFYNQGSEGNKKLNFERRTTIFDEETN